MDLMDRSFFELEAAGLPEIVGRFADKERGLIVSPAPTPPLSVHLRLRWPGLSRNEPDGRSPSSTPARTATCRRSCCSRA